MTMFQRISIVLAVLLLAGCAELKELTGGSGAPVEDRSAPPTMEAAAPAQPSGEVVETRPLPSGDGSVQPMPETVNMGPIKGGRVVGVTREQEAMLHDPANPLSKRVIYFDFDSDAIREEFRPLIEAHAKFLKDNAAARIILQGHTDERGSRDYNLALGQRRAESVKQALNLMGVRIEQVETVSLGEEKPAEDGHDEAAWKLNRRAEIHYLGE